MRIALTLFFASALAAISAPAAAASNLLGAEGLGFISSAKSAEWTAQAKMSRGTVANIQPFREAPVLGNYKTIADARMVLSTVKLSDAQRQELTELSSRLLKERSKSLAIVPVLEAQATLYSSLSVCKEDDGTAIIEVMIVISDVPETKANTSRGVSLIASLAKSVIWANVVRKRFDGEAVTADGVVAYAVIEKDVKAMYETGLRSLLLAL